MGGVVKSAVKAGIAEAMAELAAEIIIDMKPQIEEFLVNDLTPAFREGVGAVGAFLAGLAGLAEQEAMSPAIASAMPPQLPKSDIANQFSVSSMTRSIRDASNAYHEDQADESRQKALVQSMVFAARYVDEAKALLVDNPEGLSVSLKDYADLLELAEEVSRFRNVRNLNEILREHGDLFDDELYADLAKAVGREIDAASPDGAVEPVQFRIDLYAMPKRA